MHQTMSTAVAASASSAASSSSSNNNYKPRWLLACLLLTIPLLSIDNLFAYHAPGAIGSSFAAYFSLDDESLASLFTVYAAPNIVLVFAGGTLMDRYGLVRTSLAFNVLILVGMIIFASTPRHSSRTLASLLIGRFLLGVGGECLCACASAMVARWFKSSRSLTFAIGSTTAIVQLCGAVPAFLILPWMLGDSGKDRLTPTIDNNSTSTTSGIDGSASSIDDDGGNVRLCLWMIVVVCCISLLANLCYAFLEVRYGYIYVSSSELADEFDREMQGPGMNMMLAEIQQHQAKEENRLAQQKQQKMKIQDAKIVGNGASPNSRKGSKSKQDGEYRIVELSDGTPTSTVESAEADGDDANAHVIINHATLQLETDSNNGSRASSDASMLSPQSSLSTTSTSSSLSSPHSSSPLTTTHEHVSLLAGSRAMVSSLRNLWNHGADDSGRRLSLLNPWSTLRAFPLLFWMVVIMQMLLSPILASFSAFGPQFFMERYHYTQEEASRLTGVLHIAIVVAPLAGAAIDKFGYRSLVQTTAAMAIPVSFIVLHLTDLNPYVIMVLLGVAFAVTNSNGLAMIADVTPVGMVGTSYGILGCGLSCALVVEPYVVGYIHQHTHRYYFSTILFILVSSLGWAMTFVVYVYDVNHDALMCESSSSREHAERNRAMAEVNQAYPELEIVFEHEEDEDDEPRRDVEDEEQMFTLDDSDDEDMKDSLP